MRYRKSVNWIDYKGMSGIKKEADKEGREGMLRKGKKGKGQQDKRIRMHLHRRKAVVRSLR